MQSCGRFGQIAAKPCNWLHCKAVYQQTTMSSIAQDVFVRTWAKHCTTVYFMVLLILDTVLPTHKYSSLCNTSTVQVFNIRVANWRTVYSTNLVRYEFQHPGSKSRYSIQCKYSKVRVFNIRVSSGDTQTKIFFCKAKTAEAVTKHEQNAHHHDSKHQGTYLLFPHFRASWNVACRYSRESWNVTPTGIQFPRPRPKSFRHLETINSHGVCSEYEKRVYNIGIPWYVATLTPSKALPNHWSALMEYHKTNYDHYEGLMMMTFQADDGRGVNGLAIKWLMEKRTMVRWWAFVIFVVHYSMMHRILIRDNRQDRLQKCVTVKGGQKNAWWYSSYKFKLVDWKSLY